MIDQSEILIKQNIYRDDVNIDFGTIYETV